MCGALRPQGGREATLNVCNPHKEIVFGRSCPHKFIPSRQLCSYPTSQRWAITSKHIYFFRFSFHTHWGNQTFPIKPASGSLPLRPTSYRRGVLYLYMQFLLRMHHDVHMHTLFSPKWLVWDSSGDSYNDIRSCGATEQHQGEMAADAHSSGFPSAWTNALIASSIQV